MTDGTRKAADVGGLVAPFDEGGQGFLHGPVQEKTRVHSHHRSRRATATAGSGPGLTVGVWKPSHTQGFRSDADLAEGSR